MVTPTQHRIYQFIKTYWETKGYAPSLMEIARGIGVRSKSLVHRYVYALHKQGLLEFSAEGSQRRIRLPAISTDIFLVGNIAAGQPIEAISQHEPLALEELIKGTDRFALRVKGNSMIDEGIRDGDIVVCQKCDHADEGAIVVALIDQHEATLKKVHYPKRDTIALIPANPNMETLKYSADRVQIQGVFVGLIRVPFR